jgi:hypothetical protein
VLIQHTRDWSWLRRLPAVLLAVALSLTGATALSSPAYAADGRAQTAEGEIRAYYLHSLDRQPTTDELEIYLKYVEDDGCHQGLTNAGFRLAASDQAQARWADPRDLVGSFYASLLDREPDLDGMDTSVSNINGRGVDWAVAEILASAEYHNRLASLCGETADGGMLMWYDALDVAEHQVLQMAFEHGATCAFMKGVKKATGLKQNVKGARLFIGTVGEVTNKVHGKLDKTCGTALELLKAAAKIIDSVGGEVEGTGYNAVYIGYERRNKPWTATTITEWTMKVGNNPVDTTTFDGSYPSLIGE